MKGYTGKILCVDLSRERIETEGLDEAVAKSFIGGRGLGGIMLYRDLQPPVSPLSQENEIIIGISPLVGTPLIGVLDYGAICYFQTLISQYGIDAKEVGSTLGMAMECYEKGIISDGDTNGLELRFGNVEIVAEMIKRIVYRRGFGDILAEGTQRAAELIGRGAREFAMAAKGSGMAGIDVRTDQSWALGHAVSTRGPDCQHHFSVIARKGDMELAERPF